MFKTGRIVHTSPRKYENRHVLGVNTPLSIEVTANGSLHSIQKAGIMVNQLFPETVERGLWRVYVRVWKKDGSFECANVVGAQSEFTVTDEQVAVWRYRLEDEVLVSTALIPHPTKSGWAVNTSVQPTTHCSDPLEVDVMLAQDIGLNSPTVLRMNEAYNSHYIDLKPIPCEKVGSLALCARQNQATDEGKFPWLILSCVQGVSHYATDGFQVFGPDYTVTGKSRFEQGQDLPSRVLQYEMSMIALQTPRTQLEPGAPREFIFTGAFVEDHAKASGSEDGAILEALLPLDWASIPDQTNNKPRRHPSSLFDDSNILNGEPPSSADLKRWFPEPRRLLETDENTGEVLSFFCGSNAHVVTFQKESQSWRPHGHILRSGSTDWVDEAQLGITCYADGMFGAQCFHANPNLNLLYSVRRNALNLQRSSGQRIFIRTGNDWSQLGTPSIFEMQPDRCRWIYRIDDREIEVLVQCSLTGAVATLNIVVSQGEPCEFLVTHRLVLGSSEGEDVGSIEFLEDGVSALLRPAKDSFVSQHLPHPGFVISGLNPESVALSGSDELLFPDPDALQVSGHHFLVFQSKVVSAFGLCTTGFTGSSVDPSQVIGDLADEHQPAIPGAFPLRVCSSGNRDCEKLREILPWFNHNAGIHFSSPHGLEQYGGAAWGVRDVTQGSVEWLLASQRYSVARRTLVEVFRHQYDENGNWPQWFMHGSFSKLQQLHAHGDICFWPLKALCDYIEASNDFSILSERIDFTSNRTFEATCRPGSVLEHCDRIFELFESRVSPGTYLVNYGEGDWDDTLQPSDRSMRTKMVSAWTVALSYHVFRQFHEVCHRIGDSARAVRMERYLEQIAKDFRKHLIADGIVAGFLVRDEQEERFLLHPRDEETGIQYRLLPMTRAILAELFDREEASSHLHLIGNHLLFNDGVRLMDRPASYEGGVEQLFRRADSAANVGREIGLMYVHAHIRYAEALAKVGDADGLWRALKVINPILLQETVSNAMRRQSNAFFSSSDADFDTRYAARENWDQLREGSVGVRGGWRIYSSSPGLFLNKVRSCLFGFREFYDDVVIDPVLPRELDQLKIELELIGKSVEVTFHVTSGCFAPFSIELNGKEISCERRYDNPYRTGGVCIQREYLSQWLDAEENRMEIHL